MTFTSVILYLNKDNFNYRLTYNK